MGFLTLDIGTTNWKAVVFSQQCMPVCSAKRPARTVQGQDGLPYYDPRQVWESVVEMIAEVSTQYPLDKLEAVSVTSMGEAVVPMGRDGQPVFPIIPWFDTRSIQQADQVRHQVGAQRAFAITGTEAGAIFSLPKMLWIRTHYPQVFARVHKWLQMADYINYRLCSRFVTDPSMACRTLAFDLERSTWSEEMLAPFGLDPSLFPEVLPSGSIVGSVNAKTAGETGLPQELPVVLGGHDHPVASIAGCTFSGNMVFDSSGTAEPFLYISQPGETLPAEMVGQRYTRHPLPQRFITWGGIVSSGVCVDWAVQRFASHRDFTDRQMQGDYNILFDTAASLPPGSDGLIFHPALRGGSAPSWDPLRKGALLGLTDRHTSVHLLRAVLEGLCYQAKRILQMHTQVSGRSIDTIRCMGGGARISLWQQIKADVTGCVVQACNVTDATPMGAAILCAYALDGRVSLEETAQAMQPGYRTFEPDAKKHRIYEECFALYLQSGDALEQLDHQLDALTRR